MEAKWMWLKKTAPQRHKERKEFVFVVFVPLW
jgi:hypothetical protein